MILTAVENCSILHGRVFVMMNTISFMGKHAKISLNYLLMICAMCIFMLNLCEYNMFKPNDLIAFLAVPASLCLA